MTSTDDSLLLSNAIKRSKLHRPEDTCFLDDSSSDDDSDDNISIRDAVKQEVFKNNEYKMIQTQNRNVLCAGKSRSGKTTTICTIKNPCYTPDADSIFSGTYNCKYQTFAIKNQKQDKVSEYTLHIVDTPGTFEIKASSDKDTARSNDIIEDIIGKCLENEITGINLILLFASFETGINPQDIDSIKIFLKLFGGSGVSIALVITRADKHNRAWRESRRKEIMEHNELSELLKNENIKIFFMGCVDESSSVNMNERQLKRAYRNVYRMREELLKFIFEAEKRVPIINMGIAQNKIAQIKEAATIVCCSVDEVLKAQDVKSEDVDKSIMIIRQNSQYLRTNKAYMSVSDMKDIVSKFSTSIDKITKSTLPDDVKKKVVGAIKGNEK